MRTMVEALHGSRRCYPGLTLVFRLTTGARAGCNCWSVRILLAGSPSAFPMEIGIVVNRLWPSCLQASGTVGSCTGSCSRNSGHCAGGRNVSKEPIALQYFARATRASLSLSDRLPPCRTRLQSSLLSAVSRSFRQRCAHRSASGAIFIHAVARLLTFRGFWGPSF